MRKRFLLSLLVALLTTLSLHAYDFQSGDLYYSTTSKTTVEVTYQEWVSASNYQGLTTATIPETVTYNGTTYSVTSIGGYAFKNCSSLTSITIPNSVTSIGGDAFADCSSLTSITLPNSVTSIGEWAFAGCSALTSITLPNSVTSIGEWAFAGCSALTSITLPESITSIGGYAFGSCSSLTSITLPNSVTSIGEGAFNGCSSLTSVIWNAKNCAGWSYESYAPFYRIRANITSFTFGEEVETIPSYLCYGMSSLTSLTLPNSVTSIGNSAFSGCKAFTSVSLDNSVTSIGWYAFSGCSSLTSIIIPNSVTSIGKGAFQECSSLTSVTIPNSVTSIGEHAFAYCYSLTSITIPNSVTSIGDRAFNDVPNIVYSGTATGSPWGARSVNGYVDGYFVYADYTKTTLLACSAAATGEVTIPNSVTSIGDAAFIGCSSLTSITLPNSVTSIGNAAFSDCSSLTSITIGNSVTSIGEGAFRNCSALTSITIPNSVTSIGKYAFWGCSSLTSVTSLSCTPPSCGSDVFKYTPSEKTLVVPSMDAYKNSSTWIDFTYFKNCLSVFVQSSNWTMGFAKIEQDVDCDSVAIISATANYGYHFKQWNDGNTDNPRTIKLTQDTTFTAEFAPNQYTLTTTTNYAERGTVQGDTIADYLTEIQLSATANYGYHFTQWGDGNTDNPRTISLTKDTNVVALFEKNQYTITTSCNAEQGTISGMQVAEYLDEITLNVLPNVGWHFTQWTDSNTDNPRTFTLTQDTTFAAEFAMDYSGKCGDDLYWAYSNQEIKITGSGAMYNYTESTIPWTLFRDSIMTVRVDSSVTSIGEYAFANTPKLAELHIGAHVEAIGANAFLGCNRLYHIYCYPVYPPFAVESSFANYNVHLHIPCEAKEEYSLDLVWGLFKYIECLDSEMGIDDPQVPIGNFHQNKIEKLLRNGQVLIIRNGKTYNIMGQRL